MLILTRKVGEVIRIGDHITIMPTRIGPNAVRLGIEAPREMNITREEIDPYEKPVQTRDDGGEA